MMADPRLPGLEQFGDAGQTAGDVPGLGALGRDTRDDVARLDRGARTTEMIAPTARR